MAYYNAGSERNFNNNIDCSDENCVVDDLSIVPLEKDSFAICELCGRVGRRDQFYNRNNKFCSLRCTRRSRTSTWRFKFMEGTENMAGLIPLEPLPQLQHWQAACDQVKTGPVKKSAATFTKSYEWQDELFGCDFLAAPVNLFKHAPIPEICTFEGMKVEVRKTEPDSNLDKVNDYFWVATVLKVKGYMGLLRYEGCGSDDSKDFWVNLCCADIHPVGWCATRGKPIIPPQSIADKYTDWKKFLVRQLTGARTLPANFYTKLHDSLVSRFSVGCIMEVVDKNRISQVKVATVAEITGKRLCIRYYDSKSDDRTFWCHEDSPLIHPVGWAFRIGHPLDAPHSYMQRVAAGRQMPNDTVPDMFYKYPNNEPPLFSVGQKIEAIDPLNLSSICAATVMKILNEGYMMIRIDHYPAEELGADWFCYHQRSPSIFPVGFAQANNIPLVPPKGITMEEFSWEEYLRESGASAAPQSVFAARGHVMSHGFVAGMRLECTDLMDPKLVCVATVARVVADLLKVHFDGWGVEYDQWLWAHSTDIYPVGWCRAVGYRLEGPVQPAPRSVTKRTTKPHRRRRRPAAKVALAPNTAEDTSQNSDMGDKSVVLPNLEQEIEMNLKSHHLQTFPEIEHVESISEDQNATLESGNDDSQIDKMGADLESDLNSDLNSDLHNELNNELNSELNNSDLQSSIYAPAECLEDTSHNINMSTAMDSSHEYVQDAPSTSTETPSNDDDSMDSKVIPRLVNTPVPLDVLNTVEPENWTTADVEKFLTINDCQPYCVNFSHITGPMLMQLTKDEIIELLEMKVGPSLKIFDLITQLKGKLNPGRIIGYK